jgi:hypothetical protein
MATATTTLTLSNNTSANFRAWAQWIHDTLDTFGLVQTADTGQIDLTTVAAPGVANTAQGYEIWRMDDALQATVPVFFKIEYGSGAAAADPSVWLTVGTGSNGTGTITAAPAIGTRIQYSGITFTTSALNVYASGDTNRFVFGMGSDVASAGKILAFGIERTKAVDGTDSSDGVHQAGIGTPGIGAAIAKHFTFIFGLAVPNQQDCFANDAPTANGAPTTAILSGNSYTFVVKPMHTFPRNPILNWLVYFNADFTRETPVNITAYGATHAYLPLGSVGTNGNSTFGPGGNAAAGSANLRAMMRYE